MTNVLTLVETPDLLNMANLSILTLFKSSGRNCSVDLFNLLDDTATTGDTDDKQLSNGPSNRHQSSEEIKFSVVIDSESCLDRLYGGYYSDWASGGQWNRMLTYIGNLSNACKLNKLHVTVAIRGGVDKQHAEELFARNSDFRERDRKSTRLNSSHVRTSRMPSSA